MTTKSVRFNVVGVMVTMVALITVTDSWSREETSTRPYYQEPGETVTPENWIYNWATGTPKNYQGWRYGWATGGPEERHETVTATPENRKYDWATGAPNNYQGLRYGWATGGPEERHETVTATPENRKYDWTNGGQNNNWQYYWTSVAPEYHHETVTSSPENWIYDWTSRAPKYQWRSAYDWAFMTTGAPNDHGTSAPVSQSHDSNCQWAGTPIPYGWVTDAGDRYPAWYYQSTEAPAYVDSNVPEVVSSFVGRCPIPPFVQRLQTVCDQSKFCSEVFWLDGAQGSVYVVATGSNEVLPIKGEQLCDYYSGSVMVPTDELSFSIFKSIADRTESSKFIGIRERCNAWRDLVWCPYGVPNPDYRNDGTYEFLDQYWADGEPSAWGNYAYYDKEQNGIVTGVADQENHSFICEIKSQ